MTFFTVVILTVHHGRIPKAGGYKSALSMTFGQVAVL
jgi:hypothetical protein